MKKSKFSFPDWLTNLIVWVSLVFLITGLYLFAEAGTALILFISVIKFLLVGLFYMEVRHGHIVWKLLLLFFAAFYAAVVILLN